MLFALCVTLLYAFIADQPSFHLKILAVRYYGKSSLACPVTHFVLSVKLYHPGPINLPCLLIYLVPGFCMARTQRVRSHSKSESIAFPSFG